uniref:Iron-sulfur cluster assembly enzyme ISCU n=1 Tax=Acanthochromis polyacanthus TaxID=80966 RepID=A0A3Q1EPZ3_9TELE
MALQLHLIRTRFGYFNHQFEKKKRRTHSDQYLQDRSCILPTYLVPDSSPPESAQRLSGCVQGRPPLAQSRYVADCKNYVVDHYDNPRNVGSLDKNSKNVGTGLVGAPACGDVMKLQIEVDENGKIVDAKFKTFGCGSAIASSSLATEWVKGKTVDDALKIKNTDIAKELCLPPVKLHCSMLAEDAIKAALSDYRLKQELVGEPICTNA